MLRYVLRRFLTAIPTLFVIVTISFFLMRLAPGGPFNQEKGLNANDYIVPGGGGFGEIMNNSFV